MQEAMRQEEVMSIMMAGEEGEEREREEREREEGMGCHGILSSLHTTDIHQQPPGEGQGVESSGAQSDSSSSNLKQSARRACKESGGVSRSGGERGKSAYSYSSEVVAYEEVQGVGCFTAYKDGRVRCLFADRSMLEIDSKGETCRGILRDGAEVVVLASNPHGVEEYVHLLHQFKEWAFRSPIQRYEAAAEEVLKQAVVQQELLKIRAFRCTARPHPVP